MRNLKEYGSYKTNPYVKAPQARCATVYQPDEYILNLILSLPARAIRMLLVIASRVDPLTGLSYCPTAELRKLYSGSLPSISAAKSDLLKVGLVAYGKANHSFYVNPKAFRAITINL